MSPLPTPSPNRKERRKRGRMSEGDRMLRELLTPWPTDCFLQYRMTNVARPSGRASLSRSHDYRSRRGHSERSRISTRLSSCNSQEFIIERGKRSVRWIVRSQYRVSVRRISYKSGRRRRRHPRGSGINTRRSVDLVKQYSGAYGSISECAHSTSRAEHGSAVQCSGESLQFINIGANTFMCALGHSPSLTLSLPLPPSQEANRKWSQFDFHLMDGRPYSADAQRSFLIRQMGWGKGVRYGG